MAYSNTTNRIEKLSIIIPVYNEIRTLRTLLERVLAAPLPCDREIIIVDDCSKDGSREFLQEFSTLHDNIKLVLHEKNGGKGVAIRTGIDHVTGDWSIIQDADLEYDPFEYQELLLPVEKGIADAVFGSRFLSGHYRRAMFFWHAMANKFLTMVCNMANDLNLTDMETCYKLIRSDILTKLIIHSKSFDLEPELTTKLARWGARIYEVPISYQGRTYAEGKKIRARDALIALKAIIKYRFFEQEYTKHDGFAILQAVRKAKRFNLWLLSQFEEFLGNEVLEAGSGIGNLTELLLNKKRLVGLDYEDIYVNRLAQAYGHLENFSIFRADLSKKEEMVALTKEGLFDSVFCINVLEHIEQDVLTLKNFQYVLKPGGRAIVLVPHNPNIYSEVDRTLGHFRRYTKEELTTKFEEAGFKVIKCMGFNRVGGFGWRISGQILRKKTLTSGQMSLFELGLPIIKLLEKIPFHSHNSVIVVGEKQ